LVNGEALFNMSTKLVNRVAPLVNGENGEQSGTTLVCVAFSVFELIRTLLFEPFGFALVVMTEAALKAKT